MACPSSLARVCCCSPGCATASDPGNLNITKVEDYHLDGSSDPIDPAGIAPYPRSVESVPPAGPGCPSLPTCTHGPSSSNPQCGPWRAFKYSLQPPDGLLSAATIATMFNLTEETGTETSDRTCAGGFKVLQAVKQWHGMYGFRSESCAEVGETCLPEQMTPDQTKYLTLTRTMTAEVYSEAFGRVTGDYQFDLSVTVDKDTGKRTLNSCTFYAAEWDGVAMVEYTPDQISFYFSTQATADLTRMLNIFFLKLSCVDFTTDVSGANPFTTAFLDRIRDLYDGTTTPDADNTLTASVDNTDISVDWFYRVNTGTPTEVRITVTMEAALTDTYVWSEVQDAAEEMITDNHWNLDNDLVYPWRTDGYFSVAPRLLYCEVPFAVQPIVTLTFSDTVPDYENPTTGLPYTAWDSIPWFDPNLYAWSFAGTDQTDSLGTLEGPFYDGQVIGKPGAIGANAFGWDMKAYGCCGVVDASYVASHGSTAHTSDGDEATAVVPKTATIWTELKEAAGIPPGNVVMHYGSGILVQKTIYLAAATKGQNWARPCGADAGLMDEGTVRCVTDITCLTMDTVCVEAEFTVDVSVLSDPSYVVGWKMAFVNDTDYDGLWEITAVGAESGGEIVLTADRTGDLPAGFTYVADDAAVFGRLRFSTATTCNADLDNENRRGNYVVLTYGMEYRYLERDRVIAQADGDCPAGAAAIRTNSINTAMGRQVETFTATEHDFSDGSGGVKCRVLSPDPWPETTADERYGTVLFQSVVMNVMAEVFWQAPHKSCAAQDAAAEWTEDPLGGCMADDFGTPEYFYAHRPLVEMKLSPPGGVPGWTTESWGGYSITPESGDKIYLGFVPLSYTGSVTGLPVAPPMTVPTRCSGELADEETSPLLVPWKVNTNECNCVNDTIPGRFAAIYAEQTNCCE